MAIAPVKPFPYQPFAFGLGLATGDAAGEPCGDAIGDACGDAFGVAAKGEAAARVGEPTALTLLSSGLASGCSSTVGGKLTGEASTSGVASTVPSPPD